MAGMDKVYEWDYLPSHRKKSDVYGPLRLTGSRPAVPVTDKGCEPIPLYVGEDFSTPDASGKQRKLTLVVRVKGLLKKRRRFCDSLLIFLFIKVGL